MLPFEHPDMLSLVAGRIVHLSARLYIIFILKISMRPFLPPLLQFSELEVKEFVNRTGED